MLKLLSPICCTFKKVTIISLLSPGCNEAWLVIWNELVGYDGAKLAIRLHGPVSYDPLFTTNIFAAAVCPF